jgi:hypothetical protein
MLDNLAGDKFEADVLVYLNLTVAGLEDTPFWYLKIGGQCMVYHLIALVFVNRRLTSS